MYNGIVGKKREVKTIKFTRDQLLALIDHIDEQDGDAILLSVENIEVTLQCFEADTEKPQ